MISTLIALCLSLIVQAQKPYVPIPLRIEALQTALVVLAEAQQLENAAATTTPIVATSSAQVVAPTPQVVVQTPQVASTPAQAAPIQQSEPQTQGVAQLLVPVCSISGNTDGVQRKNEPVTFNWEMNSEAVGSVTGYGALPHYASQLPQYQTKSGNTDYITIDQSTTTTYTLTETMSDPAYQQTTTCSATVAY